MVGNFHPRMLILRKEIHEGNRQQCYNSEQLGQGFGEVCDQLTIKRIKRKVRLRCAHTQRQRSHSEMI